MQYLPCCMAQRIQAGRRLQASEEHLGTSRAQAQVRVVLEHLPEVRGGCIMNVNILSWNCTLLPAVSTPGKEGAHVSTFGE